MRIRKIELDEQVKVKFLAVSAAEDIRIRLRTISPTPMTFCLLNKERDKLPCYVLMLG